MGFRSISRGGVGWRLYGRLDSTQDEAWRWLETDPPPSGSLVLAFRQTAGRGRLGRDWQSPPGGLWFSILLYPVPSVQAGGLLLAAAYQLADSVFRLTGRRPAVKLPNDLYLESRKLAGLLLERRGDRVVLGIGLNVNCSIQSRAGNFKAISLRETVGVRCSRQRILDDFLAGFQRRLPGRFF
ncbi:MAG TPA: biotin--[acetyl-CoA-carboxylase] ligase [bacterium]|nr:biotin--[acetyl-CoA-carboxylase] ligase [bacterium]HNS48546.1 biotin--[acetyl-CoA-carboxylase] ligase [bacterium]